MHDRATGVPLRGSCARESAARVGGEEQDAAALALEEARLFLRNTGMAEAEIRQLAGSHRVLPEVTLTAPAAGVILERHSMPNARFERGAELFRIADLTHVSIVADVFADDADAITRGTRARVTRPDQPGVVMTAAASVSPG